MIVYVRVPITIIVNHVCNNHIGFASKTIVSHLVFATIVSELFLHNGKVISWVVDPFSVPRSFASSIVITRVRIHPYLYDEEN